MEISEELNVECMKISHINFSDNIGGASKAAMRICDAVNLVSNIEAELIVANKSLDRSNIIEVNSKKGLFYSSAVRKLESIATKIFFSSNQSTSFSFHPSNSAKRINALNSDIIHLHWINGGMLSIADIAKINKPKIWTLHDMWPFCATEHYAKNDNWQKGYANQKNNRSVEYLLNSFIWNKKNLMWDEPFQIVAPSMWMADCARQSKLFESWPITVIKNPIDAEKWFPSDTLIARELLGLPADIPLVLFGAAGGINDPRKGFKYIEEAMTILQHDIPNIQLAIFGNSDALDSLDNLSYKIHNMGVISDTNRLRNLYTACDVFVLPSLQDNLPNTGVESIACGTPIAAFNLGGMEDIVIHKKTGYLAASPNSEELANGLHWILNHANHSELSKNCSQHVLDNFSFSVVANQYTELYTKIFDNQ